MENSRIIVNEICFDGPGVYALVDTRGKKYIGSSENVAHRIMTHERQMENVKNGKPAKCISEKMKAAVLAGEVFTAEIIKEMPRESCLYDLLEMERAALEDAGGIAKTYNKQPIEIRRESDYRQLAYWERSDSPKAFEIADWIRKTIKKRESPLCGEKTANRISIYCDYGDEIRSAAVSAGQSLQGYIMQAVRERMEREKGDKIGT